MTTQTVNICLFRHHNCTATTAKQKTIRFAVPTELQGSTLLPLTHIVTIHFNIIFMYQDCSLTKATILRTRQSAVRVSEGARDFSMLRYVQTSCRALPALYPTGTGVKAARDVNCTFHFQDNSERALRRSMLHRASGRTAALDSELHRELLLYCCQHVSWTDSNTAATSVTKFFILYFTDLWST
jgi:hypothetical protein